MADDSSDSRNRRPAEDEPPRSSEELLRRYAAGERFFPDADIPEYSSLREAVLAGAVFKDAWLSCVDFRGADLRGCRFECCNVKCSDFRGADLRGAAFIGSTPVEATLWDGANVEGADFSGVTFHSSLIQDRDFPFGKWGGRA
jgi:uncharacterized protein YjbI with pentapeptide repeats